MVQSSAQVTDLGDTIQDPSTLTGWIHIADRVASIRNAHAWDVSVSNITSSK